MLCIPWVGWRSRPPPLGPRAAAEDAILAECDAILSEHPRRSRGSADAALDLSRALAASGSGCGVARLLEGEAALHAGDARTAVTGHWLAAEQREELPPALQEFWPWRPVRSCL